MAPLARKFLRLFGFLVLFSAISKGFYILFGDAPIISNETAMRVAGWISTPSSSEDIYDVFDYAVIILNAVISIIVFSVIVQFIPFKKMRDKTAGKHITEITKGILGMGLRVLVVTALFLIFLTVVDYDKFLPADAGYSMPICVTITILLTVSAYWMLLLVGRWLKVKYGA